MQVVEQERLKAVRSVRQMAVQSGVGENEEKSTGEEEGKRAH